MTKILIVDDHEITRKGLASVFEQADDFEVIGELQSGTEALPFIKINRPDIVIMDVMMPGENGVDIAKSIKEEFPEIKVTMLSAFCDPKMVEKAVKIDVEGYMLKDASSEELLKAIRIIDGGEKYLHPLAAKRMINKMASSSEDGSPGGHNLTERELKVLELITEGFKNREIASKLYLGEETVKTHVSNIFLKLGVSDRTQAALHAIRNGIVED